VAPIDLIDGERLCELLKEVSVEPTFFAEV
jgi:hypothetical protein